MTHIFISIFILLSFSGDQEKDQQSSKPLSILTQNGWYGKADEKCSARMHFEKNYSGVLTSECADVPRIVFLYKIHQDTISITKAWTSKEAQVMKGAKFLLTKDSSLVYLDRGHKMTKYHFNIKND